MAKKVRLDDEYLLTWRTGSLIAGIRLTSYCWTIMSGRLLTLKQLLITFRTRPRLE